MRKTTLKRSVTHTEYRVCFKGYDITVPIGSIVSNSTACGPDDTYRFWKDYHAIAEKLTGYKDSTLLWDLDRYGLNIPPEYCEPYK